MRKIAAGLICVLMCVLPAMHVCGLEANFSMGPVFDLSQKVNSAGDTLYFSGAGPSFTAQLVVDRLGLVAVFEPIFFPIAVKENDTAVDISSYSTFLLMNATIGLTYTLFDLELVQFYLGGGVMTKPKLLAGDSVDMLDDYSLDAIVFLPAATIELSRFLFINVAAHLGLYFDESTNASRDIAFGIKMGIGIRLRT
jgi:hypothetical protein